MHSHDEGHAVVEQSTAVLAVLQLDCQQPKSALVTSLGLLAAHDNAQESSPQAQAIAQDSAAVHAASAWQASTSQAPWMHSHDEGHAVVEQSTAVLAVLQLDCQQPKSALVTSLGLLAAHDNAHPC